MEKMKQSFSTALLALVTLGLVTACSQSESKKANSESVEKASFTMYKNPGCMCCDAWAEHMESNGYKVEIKPIENLAAFKFSNKVPNDISSCHTSVIGDYIVEGHVPASDVDRLLKEQPDAKGIAVPGMPTGSPGMEVPGRPADAYNVMIFQADGSREVYASH